MDLRVRFLTMLFASFLLTDVGTAQTFVDGEFFLDTFNDGDHHDSDPVHWRRGTFNAERDIVVDGDLQIQGIHGNSSIAPSQLGSAYWSYEDASITTQLRIQDPDGDAWAGVYGRSRSGAVYYGFIDEGGELSIGESSNTSATIFNQNLQTGLDPVAHDVKLRMDFEGDMMSLWAWHPDNPMPTDPLLTYQDSTLTSGTFATLAGGSGDAVYRWFGVGAIPVPEPTGLTPMLVGLAAMLLLRARRGPSLSPHSAQSYRSTLSWSQRAMFKDRIGQSLALAVVAIGVLSCPLTQRAAAQVTALVPSTFADIEGEFSIAETTPVEYRSQQVYSASEFSNLPPGESLLSRVAWRPDGNLAAPETYTAEQWIMRFSTTSKNPGELDAAFVNNIGADEVVVYGGPASITTTNSGPAGGPKLIDYGIDFQVPFPYDPAEGNLLWDLTIIGGSQPLSLDWTFEAEGLTSTISTNGDPADSLAASYVQASGGHIAQFTFVPEPSTSALLAVALVLIGRCRSGRRVE